MYDCPSVSEVTQKDMGKTDRHQITTKHSKAQTMCMFYEDVLLSMHMEWYGMVTLIARFMGQTWGPSGADRTQVGPMLAPWTLLSE